MHRMEILFIRILALLNHVYIIFYINHILIIQYMIREVKKSFFLNRK